MERKKDWMTRFLKLKASENNVSSMESIIGADVLQFENIKRFWFETSNSLLA